MLLTSRKLVQRKLIDIESDMRGTLRNFGLKVSVVGTIGYEARIRHLVEGFPRLAAILEPLLMVRRVMSQQLATLHKMLLDTVPALSGVPAINDRALRWPGGCAHLSALHRLAPGHSARHRRRRAPPGRRSPSHVNGRHRLPLGQRTRYRGRGRLIRSQTGALLFCLGKKRSSRGRRWCEIVMVAALSPWQGRPKD